MNIGAETCYHGATSTVTTNNRRLIIMVLIQYRTGVLRGEDSGGVYTGHVQYAAAGTGLFDLAESTLNTVDPCDNLGSKGVVFC